MDTVDFFLVGWTGERNTSADRAAQIAEAKERRDEAEAAKLRASAAQRATAPASPSPAAPPAPAPPEEPAPEPDDPKTGNALRDVLLIGALAAGGIYLLWKAV